LTRTAQPATPTLQEATSLSAWNAAEKGDTDILPRSLEFRVLRGHTRELALAVLSGEDPAAIETVDVPLSRRTLRHAHLLDPATYLRLFGPVFVLAERIEAARVPPTVATSARWRLNQSRGRIIQLRSRERQEAALARLEKAYPYVAHLDVATFFPSLDSGMIHGALAPFGRREADLFVRELARLDIRGLPVGAWPPRLVGEAVLHSVDQELLKLGRDYVRAMDDFAIGADSPEDAEAIIVKVSEIVAPLELNKSKTRVREVQTAVPGEDPVRLARRLLAQADSDPDRVQLAAALTLVRKRIAKWDRRTRERWTRRLVDAAARICVCVPQLLQLIEKLMPGTDGPEWSTLENLLNSPTALHRAEAARLLSRHGRDVRADLTRLALVDVSALVRREAMFGLTRLGANPEVKALLRGTPRTGLDGGAWIIAAGVVGDNPPFRLNTPYQRLLYQAARQQTPGDI